MATFKPEIQNKRADGTYNVRIRITHNRSVRRISTNIFVTDADLTRGLKIKNLDIQEMANSQLADCRELCNKLGNAVSVISIDELAEKVKEHLQGGENFRLKFVNYMSTKAREMKKSTGSTYQNAANALLRFLEKDDVDISAINAKFLREFEFFLENEPSQRGNNRKEKKKDLPAKGGRAVSKYLGCVRAMHNMAKKEFNDEDRGVIHIPYSPFKNFKIKQPPRTRKRALPIQQIQAIINLPYNGNIRRNLAKDCFILSFALIGMNSADMFHTDKPKGEILTYNRKKTADRRSDRAEMQVMVEGCVFPLMDKYKDTRKLFDFHRRYANHSTFNRALNIGLKLIGEEIGAEDLEFYAARHSWATIARSAAVGIDKATVHEALNHVDQEMKVTDIYIDRDWSVIWEANRKVLALFNWSEIELMGLI